MIVQAMFRYSSRGGLRLHAMGCRFCEVGTTIFSLRISRCCLQFLCSVSVLLWLISGSGVGLVFPTLLPSEHVFDPKISCSH